MLLSLILYFIVLTLLQISILILFFCSSDNWLFSRPPPIFIHFVLFFTSSLLYTGFLSYLVWFLSLHPHFFSHFTMKFPPSISFSHLPLSTFSEILFISGDFWLSFFKLSFASLSLQPVEDLSTFLLSFLLFIICFLII